MKRWICMLLALVLALGMTACGGESREEVSGNVAPVQTEPKNETEAPATEPEREVSMGRMEGGVYTNTYAGFSVALDSTWTFYSAEELQEIPENVAEILEGTELGEAADSLPQFTDMMAESVEAMTSINVLYQKLDMQTRLAYAVLSEKQILEQMLTESEMLISSYAQAGIEVESMELKTVTFAGKERTALHTSATVQGVNYYILQLFDYNLGAYSVVTTFASFVEDNTTGLLELCSAVE